MGKKTFVTLSVPLMDIRSSFTGQLDLFIHSGPVAFASDAVDALMKRDAARAEECIRLVSAEEPGFRTLGAFRALCRAVREWPFACGNSEEVAETIARLEQAVQPEAKTVMGDEAADFMRPFWFDLANAAGSQTYDPTFPQSFRAGLFLRCGEFAAAAKSVESTPGLDSDPNLLYWLCIARSRAEGIEASRSILMKLALLAPERLPGAIDEIDHPLLRRDWIAFRNECHWLDLQDASEDAWFPAWWQMEHSDKKIAPDSSPNAAAPADQAFVLMGRLIELEKRGYSAELVSIRSRLKKLAPDLFAAYMTRRGSGHR